MSNKDGGQAFPGHYWCSIACRLESSRGMTLRDYFAGQALAGLLANWPPNEGIFVGPIAVSAYELADAMLAAREASDD